MIQIKCPRCSTLISGEPGQAAVCPNCGLRAEVPATSTPIPSPPTPAPPAPPAQPAGVRVTRASEPPSGPVMPAFQSLSVWAYLLSVVGLGTFFLARFFFPFLFAVAGIATGAWAFQKNRQDRRGLVAAILGIVAIVLASIYWALQ